MPYIKPEAKDKFDAAINAVIDDLMFAPDPDDPGQVQEFQPGELTYVLYVIARRAAMCNPGYAHFSRVRASLQDAADEFYRRIMAPYEDEKIAENGDAL